MSDEKLTPERAVRLLRAKAGELEAQVKLEWDSIDNPTTTTGLNMHLTHIAADIALIASLLADHIERSAKPPAEDVDSGYWQGST